MNSARPMAGLFHFDAQAGSTILDLRLFNEILLLI